MQHADSSSAPASPALTSLPRLAALLLVVACSGSGSDDSTATGTAALLLSSSGDGGVFALEANVASVELVRADGARTANLLPAPTTVELAGLAGAAEWLAELDAGAGTYTAIAVEFERDSVDAISTAGASLAVDVPSGRCEIELDRPLEVTQGSASALEVVIDLDESLRPGGTTRVFEPTGEAFARDPGTPDRALDELVGLVVAASLPARTLQVRVYRDDGMSQPMGTVRIEVDATSALFDDDDTPFPGVQALFGSLRLGLTVVEVEGKLQQDGSILAERLAIQDQAGGVGRPPIVEIEGMVLHVFDDDPPFQGGEKIVLLIRELEQGAEHAKAVLEGLGSPTSIDILFAPHTRFRGPLGMDMDPDELRVGQIIDATFEVFEGPPFVATRIQLESLHVHFSGTIQEVLPDAHEVVLRFDDDCWNRHSDDFDDDGHGSGSHRVHVDLSGADVSLDVRGDPAIEVAQLGVGMRLHVHGTLERRDDDLDGEPDTTYIDARSASLRPGRLEGRVTAADPDALTVELGSYDVQKTFGEEVSGFGSIGVRFADGVRFFGPIRSTGELYRAFEQLGEDEVLELRVEGVAAEAPGEVLAWEAKAKRRGGPGHGHD